MRISDWSSDVCSSDLRAEQIEARQQPRSGDRIHVGTEPVAERQPDDDPQQYGGCDRDKPGHQPECGPGDEPQRFALRVLHRTLPSLISRKKICRAMLTVYTHLSFTDKYLLSPPSTRTQ